MPDNGQPGDLELVALNMDEAEGVDTVLQLHFEPPRGSVHSPDPPACRDA
jgi:hypothetical protein